MADNFDTVCLIPLYQVSDIEANHNHPVGLLA